MVAKFDRRLSAANKQTRVSERVNTQQEERCPVEGKPNDIGRIENKSRASIKHVGASVQSPFNLTMVESLTIHDLPGH